MVKNSNIIRCWHAANPRTLLATERGFSAVVEVDGEQVELSGYADRVELDADGNLVVVDLKTGKSRSTGPEVARHPQLGLYQYAVDRGGLDDLVGEERPGPPRSGGAELVQLGLPDTDAAVVQAQEPQPAESAGREQLREQLARAARLLRAEEFPAVTGAHCQRCDFVALCPARSAASVISR